MANENFLTDIEKTLKDGLESGITLGGVPVPVQIVTPDPDLVELELPCLTLQLTDFRRDTLRSDNEREVENDMDNMVAMVRKNSEPYNLHYLINLHAEKSRDDRLLLGQLIYFVDENPVITTDAGEEVFLHRDITFRELSKERDFEKSVEIMVRTRLTARYEDVIPLVQERITETESIQ